MRFLNPAGLWLLLGIPILIIIYLIKAQHEDRPVSSTYIWKLSNRFMKKRLPLQRIRKIMLFVLQLLLIVAAALIVSRPAIVDGESREYIAVIDASASMQIADETGTTRFDYAKEEVKELSKQIRKGHTMSIILASDSASYVVQKSTSVNEVKHALKKLVCTQGGCNTEEALSMVQMECDRNPNAEVIFYTDCAYEEAENISVVNLNQGEWNVSLESLSSETVGTDTTFTGSLVSYNKDASVAVGFKINGSVVDAQMVECVKDTKTEITFTVENVMAFETAEMYIEESDALRIDNQYVLCSQPERTYDVLLISQSPLYLESVLKALGNCEVSVVTNIDIAELSNFDLYIFDGIAPEEYPTDGAILIFGTELMPEGLTAGTISQTSEKLRVNAEVESEIYEGLTLTDTMVTNYAALSGNDEWQPLLFCAETPVFMTRKMESGLRCSLMSFDLHNSNLPMQSEYGVLMRNIVEFSVPTLLKEQDYAVGDQVEMTVLPQAEELYVELPDGTTTSFSTGQDYATFVPEEVGVYTAVMTKVGRGQEVDFFVHVPEGEVAKTTGSSLKIEKPVQTDGKEKEEDAASELWFYLTAAMLVILLIEWGWYYHEQY